MHVKQPKKLQEQNIDNAKLLYTNRILKNSSLNERQKQVVVERLSKVDSVQKAKVVYETLRDTLKNVAKPTGSKRSLSEHVNRGSLLSLKTETEEKPANNAIVERNQRLAGISRKQ